MTFGELRGGVVPPEEVAITLPHHRSLAEHPYARDDDPAFLLMMQSGSRVARFGLLPGLIRAGDEFVRVSWGSEFDYDGDPAHRAAAGLLFLRALERAGSYAGAGPSAHFEPLLRAAGLELHGVPRYAALLRSGPYLARRRAALPRAAALLADVALGTERAVRRVGVDALELVPVKRFDDQIDRIERARAHCGPYRDHVELNWVLARPWVPEHRYEAFLLRSGAELAGFALVRTKHAIDHVLVTVTRLALTETSTELARPALAALLSASRGDVFDLYTNEAYLARAARSLGLRSRGDLRVTARFSTAVEAALRRARCSFGTMRFQHGEGDVIFA